MSYSRTSPIGELPPGAAAIEVRGMRVLARAGDEAAKLASVALADFSCLVRCGLKGPGAAQWLQAQGVDVPGAPNRWAPLPGGGLVARLGRSEFFLEDGAAADTARRLMAALGSGAEGAYPVVRQDAALALFGPRSRELLAQTCNVDFDSTAPQEAVMTQMVGVSVLAVRCELASMRCLRLWCDATFAPYLWQTLSEIAVELGGGIVGSEGLLP